MITSKTGIKNLGFEEALRKEVLIPLMQKMGYLGAFDNHGSHELGKDIVGVQVDSLGHPANTVVVAKKGRVTGDACHEAGRQVNQAFKTKFRNGVDNNWRRATFVWVAANGPIPSSSREQILSHLDESLHDRVVFLDLEELWNQWQKYFPVTIAQFRQEIQQAITKYEDEAITVTDTLSATSALITVQVKDASKLTESHTHGRIAFDHPDPDARAAMAQRFTKQLQSSEPFTLDGRHIRIDAPPVLQRILENYVGIDENRFDTITLIPQTTLPKLQVRILIECDDEDSAALDIIEWQARRLSDDELELSNDEQEFPIKFSLIMPRMPGEGRYTIGLQGERVSCSTILEWLDFRRCLSKPGKLLIKELSSPIIWPPIKRTKSENPDIDPDMYDFYYKMSVAEHVLQRAIYIPSDGIDDNDWESVWLLFNLLRDPHVSGQWTEGNLILEKVLDDPAIATFLKEKEHLLSHKAQMAITIAGQQIELGEIFREFESVRLADPAKVKHDYSSASPGESFKVKLVPGDSKTMKTTYLQWKDHYLLNQYRQTHR